jgi:hypothetical protein
MRNDETLASCGVTQISKSRVAGIGVHRKAFA